MERGGSEGEVDGLGRCVHYGGRVARFSWRMIISYAHGENLFRNLTADICIATPSRITSRLGSVMLDQAQLIRLGRQRRRQRLLDLFHRRLPAKQLPGTLGAAPRVCAPHEAAVRQHLVRLVGRHGDDVC